MTGPEPVRDLPTPQALPIEAVREADSNPRVISDRAVEVVAESLRRFGWKQPIVTDRDGNIIVGHTRHRAARLLGLTQVPVVIADDLDHDEAAAYRIVDNRTRDYTTWDLPALAKELEALSADYADVLALADWEAVTSRFDELNKGELDLPEEVKNALDGGFSITVYFQSKEEALAAEQDIMDLPGVFDVRHDL